MNLLLAAHAQGLGAVWTGVYPGEERIAAVREILSIPDGFMPLNVVPVGYPAENPPAKDKWNRRRFTTTSGDTAYACALTIFDLAWND